MDVRHVRGVTVAIAATRPGDTRGTGRALLAVLARTPLDRIGAEPCPRCGEPHGRPLIPTGSASVSHAGGWTVAAFAAAELGPGPIGVDIEAVTGADEKHASLEAILRRSFATSRDALRHWTLVEAVVKADGRGLEIDPADVHVDTTGSLAWVTDRPDARYELAPLPLDAPLVGSLARPAGHSLSLSRNIGPQQD